jgi:peptidyl-prolyl cis-trans isomerase C
MHISFHGIIQGVALGLSLILSTSPVFSAQRKPFVVAVVNGSEIDVNDFNRELIRLQRLVLATGVPLTCPQVAALEKEVVEGLIRRELLFQESKKRGIKVSEAEIEAELKKLKAQYASENEFTYALAAMKVSPESLRRQVERALAIQGIIEKEFASKVTVNDKEIWAYYDRNRDSFREPEKIRASHILIKVDPRWDNAKKAEARKKIESIEQKARKGQDFVSLAKTYSEDPSAAKGGDLGDIRPGQVVKPFEEALFALKPGEVSDVVETQLGYHLIKAGDRKPETTIPFEKLKDQLKSLLKQEKGKEEANLYTGKLREKAKVEIFLPTDK